LVLASAGSRVGLGVMVALWGVHMRMTQGLLAAMVADTTPDDLLGTTYGYFNLLSGMALLASSGIAGVLCAYFSDRGRLFQSDRGR
jgi:MFS family permease